MASTIHPQQQLRIYQKLKKIAEKMITKDDPKYRTLYLNNPKLQHTVLAFDGGLEFLYNLGFEPHITSRDKLICNQVNARVVQACLICLEDKIETLSDDDNYKKEDIHHHHNVHPQQQQPNDLISEQQQYIASLNQQYAQQNHHNDYPHPQQQHHNGHGHNASSYPYNQYNNASSSNNDKEQNCFQ